MSELTIHHEPAADDDDANQLPPPSPQPQRQSRAGRAVGAAITGLAAAGAVAYGATHPGSQEVAGTPVAAHSADNPGRMPDTTAPAPETTTAAPAAEAPVPTQLNIAADIPDEQVEKLFGLPPDSFDGHWDKVGPSTEPAPEGVPVPLGSQKLLTPDFNITVDVYNQSYAEAVEKQGGIIEKLPSEGGMNILSIPQLSMVERSFVVDDVEDGNHTYTITVTATDTTPEAKADFAAEVIKDFTASTEQ